MFCRRLSLHEVAVLFLLAVTIQAVHSAGSATDKKQTPVSSAAKPASDTKNKVTKAEANVNDSETKKLKSPSDTTKTAATGGDATKQQVKTPGGTKQEPSNSKNSKSPKSADPKLPASDKIKSPGTVEESRKSEHTVKPKESEQIGKSTSTSKQHESPKDSDQKAASGKIKSHKTAETSKKSEIKPKELVKSGESKLPKTNDKSQNLGEHTKTKESSDKSKLSQTKEKTKNSAATDKPNEPVEKLTSTSKTQNTNTNSKPTDKSGTSESINKPKVTKSAENVKSSKGIKPNIVIFIADDLGIGDVGCFGNDTIRTPNIDGIARDGVRLTHNLAAEALCTPSRAALLTGRYPIRYGMTSPYRMRAMVHTSVTAGLPANETTIAEAAKRIGYVTGLIGKWHLGLHCGAFDLFCHHPSQQGFDHYYGLPLSNLKDFGKEGRKVINDSNPHLNTILLTVIFGGAVSMLLLRKLGIVGKFIAALIFILLIFPSAYVHISLNYLTIMNSLLMRNLECVEQPIDFEHVTQNLVSEGVKFVEDAKASQKPFLLVMSWLQVHTALHASKRFQGKSRHGPYGDNVEEMDWSVGEIMKALERLGLLDNTFVYFTSDNGGYLEEKFGEQQEGGWNGIYRGGKGQGGMDGGIRIPTAAMWKGHIKPGTIINLPTSHMDLMPTFLAMWGQSLPTDRVIDGVNIYPLLSGQSDKPPHSIMLHYCGTEVHSARYIPNNEGDVYKVYYFLPNWNPGTYTCDFMCFCRDGYSTRLPSPLLYNIGRDPAEAHQLDTSQPEHQRIVKLLNDALESHVRGLEKVPEQFTLYHLIPVAWLQPCCNFPFCNCRDPVYFLDRLKKSE